MTEESTLLATTEAEQRFERFRRRSGLFLAPLVGLGVYWLTAGSAMAPEGRRLSGILCFVATLWITEAVPIPVAGLFGAALAVVFQVADARKVLAPFAEPIIFLFLGSFMLAESMTLHRLDRRFALFFLSLPFLNGRPLRLMAALGLATGLLSALVSNTATAAMMLPIAAGILRAMADVRKARGLPAIDLRHYPFSSGMMLMVAYAASIGGIVTPVGSPPNLICIGQLQKTAGVQITFMQWVLLCLPLFALMFIALQLMLWVLHRPQKDDSAVGEELSRYISRQREELGPWTRGQVNTVIAFSVAVALWIGPGVLAAFLEAQHPAMEFFKKNVPESVAALLAATLLFVLPTDWKKHRFTMDWKQAVNIDWGTILLFGAGLSLGELMGATGVAKALGESLVQLTGAQSLWALTAVATVIAIILTEVTSNTAATTIVIPIVIPLAMAAGVSPVAPALGAALGASFAFMLPVSTPPNAIAYGSGMVPITKMIRAGIIYDVIGFVIIMAGLRVLCPLLGF